MTQYKDEITNVLHIVPPYDDKDVSNYHLKGGVVILLSERWLFLSEEAREKLNNFILELVNDSNNLVTLEQKKNAKKSSD